MERGTENQQQLQAHGVGLEPGHKQGSDQEE